MRPWRFKNIIWNYGNFWKLLPGKYEYKILFFEKYGHVHSTKDKFPLTLYDGTLCSKDDFVKIVQESFEVLNKYNFGFTLNCIGHNVTDNEEIAFNTKDNINAIVYLWKPPYGGLSAPISTKGFGIKTYLGDKIKRDWYIAVLRHEFTHCLGFSHKDVYFKGLLNQPVISGIKNKGEFTEDTIHGIKTVYDISSKFKITGIIEDFIKDSYEYIEAFIVNWKTKEIYYQSPIDDNGYFEFRIDDPLKHFKLLVIGNNNEFHYKITKKYKLNYFFKQHNFSFKLDNQVENLEALKKTTKIKII